jgi:hypothetical protein
VIDAHPEDITMEDFTKPDGTKVMRTIADYRQLNDALFHAGLNSGSQFEWVDEPNRLHFYVIDRSHDRNGILSYVLAVRSLDGAGQHQRAVRVGGPPSHAAAAGTSTLGVLLMNPGEPDGKPDAAFGSDVYRMSVSVKGAGWRADLSNALTAVQFGKAAAIPIQITCEKGAAPGATLIFTAVSESDPTKRATLTTALTAR